MFKYYIKYNQNAYIVSKMWVILVVRYRSHIHISDDCSIHCNVFLFLRRTATRIAQGKVLCGGRHALITWNRFYKIKQCVKNWSLITPPFHKMQHPGAFNRNNTVNVFLLWLTVFILIMQKGLTGICLDAVCLKCNQISVVYRMLDPQVWIWH